LRALFIATAAIAISAPFAHAGVEDDLRDGDKYFDDSDWKRAAAAYDRAITAAPGQVAAEAYGKRAAIFLALKDFKGGLTFVEKAKSRYPNTAEILEQEALLLWESGSRDGAIAVAEKVVKSRPQAFLNQRIIGEYYAAGNRDPVKTAAAFEGYIAHRPSNFEGDTKYDVLPRLQLGFAYLANARSVLGDGDEGRAKQFYTKAKDQFEFIQRKLGKKQHAMSNSDNGLCAAYVGLSSWDQAISVCERVIQDPRRIDPNGSAWFNLATAYLNRKQTKKARSAGNEYTRLRKNEARGYMLIGDSFFEDRDWTSALDQYLRAEKLIRPNQSREKVQLSIRLGKTYRRLPAPTSGVNQNLALAIDKLSTALAANPDSAELVEELGDAYIDNNQDAKAATVTEKFIAGPEFSKAGSDERADVLVIAGKALYNQQKLKEARGRFDEARQLRPTDISVQKYLVVVINEQAFREAKNYQVALALLGDAEKIDPKDPMTQTNIAVLQIERGQCETAEKQLVKLDSLRGRDAVLTQRLLGRAYLCFNKPDVKRAAAAFADAEKEAKKANAQLALAEIYAEWGPLIWDTDLAGAVEKLDFAVQVSSQDPEIAPAAKRNLALALYRRGWKLMREGKAAEAANDFDRASRDPGALKGVEKDAIEFSLALALLDSGKANEAAKSFSALANKGNQSAYLKGSYAKVGGQFLAAYANSRNAQGAARETQCGRLSKLAGELGGRARELVASCYESAAYDHFRSGALAAAGKAIGESEKFASAEQKRRLQVDRATINLGPSKAGELEALSGSVPEALVNLGILYDQMGKPKEAYDAWQRAKAKNVQSRDLQKWIDAKKRIYGY
jgi:tetratricopeptide (TPR) repeat protein